MKHKLDIPALRAFYTVCQCGSFTDAAELLNVTQSTISHQIRKLEQGFNRKLLQRTTRNVSTTQEGQILFSEARAILALVDAAQARLDGEALIGEVRLGVPEEIATDDSLSELLARFRQSQPHVRLALSVGISKEFIEGIDNHSLDLALVKNIPANSSHLISQPLCWAGDKRLLSQPRLPLAFFPEPCVFRSHALKKLEEAGIAYDVVMTTTSHQSLHAAAKNGLALTVLARSNCPANIRIHQGLTLLPALSTMGYQLKLSTKANSATRYLETLIRESLG